MTKRIEVAERGRTVADNIALLRRTRGLQYKQLAADLAAAGRPIPPLGLRRIESYERRIDVDDLEAFAHVFGLSPAELLGPIRVVASGLTPV